MNPDPLQYIKDIQRLDWKSLGYSDQMTRVLQGAESRFVNGVDADGYYEEGSFQGAQIQSISANKIITSELVAGVNVGTGAPNTYLKIDGPNQRFIQVVDGLPQIVLGEL